nr:MAG TPA: DNA-directed RNA polymerase subunit A'' [Bacteriophage sp.]
MKKTIQEMLRENIDDILELKEQGYKLENIAKLYNVSRQSIGRALKAVGQPARNILTDEIINDLIQEYKNGVVIKELSRKYHFGESTISKILKENNIHVKTYGEHSKKYTLNEHYFDIVDTEEKAYIIGLLMADGNITHNRLSLSLVESDRHILDRINSLLDSNKPLYFINYSQKNQNWKDQYCLSIYSKYMCNILKSLGINENKSLILEYPKWLSDNLFKHFIRGFIDGDGCILKTRNGIEITSTYNFCVSVKEKIYELLNIEAGIHKDKRRSNSYNLYIKNYIGTKTFLDYIYKDATIYLNRKYSIYKEKYIDNPHAA